MVSESAQRVRLDNSLRSPVRDARRIGPTDPGQIVHLNVITRRRADAPPLPGQSYWMATPPGRRAFVSVEDFARRFGSAQEDQDLIAQFAARHDLSVVEASLGRRSVIVSGTVAAAEDALAVRFSDYQAGPETYRGHEGYVHLPADIAGVVEGILGLDNRRLGRRATNGGPYGASPLTPPQVAAAYQFPTVPPDATGQTIGILEFGGGFNQADLYQYFSGLGGLKAPVPVVGYGTPVLAGLSANSPDIEVTLDIDVAGSVAQGATIVVYFGTGTKAPGVPDELGWSALLGTAIHDATNKPAVLSISWSFAEEAWPTGALDTISTLFQEAAALGITVFASSGDYGASGYPALDGGDGHQHVHYPASDPYVTGCGGTTLVLESPGSENTWNDSTWNNNLGWRLGATGGGVSGHFQISKAPWQSGVSINGQALSFRGVPDVAGNASPFSGYDLVLYGTSASQISQLNEKGPGYIAGTSAVAPLYAGLIALINAQISADFRDPSFRIGYLNPTLYALQGTGIFNDIADGGNNDYNGVAGYKAMVGWDACTGLGSINGDALAVGIVGMLGVQNQGCLSLAQLRSLLGAARVRMLHIVRSARG
jgi:kumamolisin